MKYLFQHPRIVMVLHHLGGVLTNGVEIINRNCHRVIVTPDSPNHWPLAWSQITREAMAYVSPTGIFAEIPDEEMDAQNTLRSRLRSAAEAANLIWKIDGKPVAYGEEYLIDPGQPQKWGEILTDRVAQTIIEANAKEGPNFTGIFLDNGWRSISWLTGDTGHDHMFQSAQRDIAIRLKRTTGLPMVGNGGHAARLGRRLLAGRMFEGIPDPRHTWLEQILGRDSQDGFLPNRLMRWAAAQPMIILHEREFGDTAVMVLAMLLGLWYSLRLRAGEPKPIYDISERWYAAGPLETRIALHEPSEEDTPSLRISRQFLNAKTRETGVAMIHFDPTTKIVLEARPPWDKEE